jgi:4-hydroxybenzoate polyprenyltransferase
LMIREYIKILRVSHWIKNLFVFVPLIFSKTLTDFNNLLMALGAFLSFSLASSIVYIINDICDIEADKNHPQKKFRPIAAGRVSKPNALFVVVILLALLVFVSIHFSFLFLVSIGTYLVINILYSLKLKEIVILDIFIIASGFTLRVFGGALAIDVYISNWLILTTLFLSLFLAVMKRRSELNINNAQTNTRKVLEYYSNNFIDQISSITAGGVIICYALYSVSERTEIFFNSDLFIYTTIFVIFGIFRYMFLVYHKNKGEDPTREIISDIPMIVNIILYTLTIIFIAYSSQIKSLFI